MMPHEDLRAFLAERVPAFRARWGTSTTFEARLDWQRMLHDGGWVAPAWPEKFGGRALPIDERARCDAELAAVKAPNIAGILGVQNVGPTIAAVGSEEQRRHLPRILSGEEIWAQGFSEPGAGSDLAALRTRAEVDGDALVINGQKIWMSDGMHATHCELLVRTDPTGEKHTGISALLMPLDLPGIDRRPIRQITGEAEFAEAFFTDVRVPMSSLLGPLHEGWRVTMTTLAHERVGVINMAARLERETLQAVAAAMAGASADVVLRDDLMRRYIDGRVVGMLGLRSLTSLRSGGQPGPEHSVIKLAWSLANQRLAETALRVPGVAAIAGLAEREAFAFLRTRASTIAAGTTEIMKDILGERVLGLPKR
jgi:alkylation response protein AidB-like acyl-CoA dehydrogenase